MTGSDSPERCQLLALLLFTLALHLLFVNQAFHMDDVQYIELARNALVHPLFPHDLPYVFDGKVVSMAGHSHPPMNAYFLALVWKLSGRLTESRAHGFYLLFPLLATWAFFTLARRFTGRPVLATLLFATVPPLVVMSHTVMADVPTLALTLAAFACFTEWVETDRPRCLALATLTLCLAAFCAYIAVAALPVLFAYAWLRGKLRGKVFLALAAPLLLLLLWQYANYLHLGHWPLQILGAYAEQLGYFQAERRVRTVASVFIYLGGTILFPALLAALLCFVASGTASIVGIAAAGTILFSRLVAGYTLPERLIVAVCFGLGVALSATAVRRLWSLARQHFAAPESWPEGFLLAWLLLTLVAILALYGVGGSNRYILPLAPPLLLWGVNRIEKQTSYGWASGLLLVAFLWNVAWSVALARADWEFAGAYRAYASHFVRHHGGSTTPLFFSGEWGFRHYLGQIGGQILNFASDPVPGAWVVKSRLCLSRAFDDRLDGALVPIERTTLTLPTRWRLLDRDSHPGFYSTGWGLLPWSWSRERLDVVTLFNWSPFFFALDQAQIEHATPEQVFPTRMNQEGQSVLVFVQPPNSVVTYRLTLPQNPRLRFRLFAQPRTEADSLDLRYRVSLEAGNVSRVLFDRAVTTANATAALGNPIEISLRPWEGKTADLRFAIEGKAARTGWAELTVFGN